MSSTTAGVSVEDYIPYALAGLREHASRLLVVVNGSSEPTTVGAKLERVADEILVRENVGFDIWAHKAALDHVGAGTRGVRRGRPDRMTRGSARCARSARCSSVWMRVRALLGHDRSRPGVCRIPLTKRGVPPYHLQSYWVAVRREMLLSEEWRSLLAGAAADAGLPRRRAAARGDVHGALRKLGFVHDVAFRLRRATTPRIRRSSTLTLLLDDGCPVLKRRPFFQWPPYLDRFAVIGRWTLEKAESLRVPDGADLAEPGAKRPTEGPERERGNARGAPGGSCPLRS